ncbi:hypothetical protein FPV67DRAFT_1780639 [Lyophyllum atratum]|nr:hypothetical protein FPV67DRAFT_1780639 [Lyophyllum atratum]
MMTTTLLNRHAVSDLAGHKTRAAQRKQRLLEIENEMRLEDAEALKMTEEQRETLLRSFTSVKVEFSDLDGLAWNAPCATPTSPKPRGRSPDHAFVILTNADLASFEPHETIRASAASRPRPRTSISSPNLSAACGTFPSVPPSLKHSYSALSNFSTSSSYSPSATIKAILKSKTPRSRSPIKGLFPTQYCDVYESDSDRTVRGSDTELDESPRPKKERKKSRGGRERISSAPYHMPTSISSPISISGSRSSSGPGHTVTGVTSVPGTPTRAPMASPWSGSPSGGNGSGAPSSPMITTIPTDPLPGSKPAYITYSPSPSPAVSSPPPNIPQTAKASIFPPVPKPGSTALGVYHLPGSA